MFEIAQHRQPASLVDEVAHEGNLLSDGVLVFNNEGWVRHSLVLVYQLGDVFGPQSGGVDQSIAFEFDVLFGFSTVRCIVLWHVVRIEPVALVPGVRSGPVHA